MKYLYYFFLSTVKNITNLYVNTNYIQDCCSCKHWYIFHIVLFHIIKHDCIEIFGWKLKVIKFNSQLSEIFSTWKKIFLAQRQCKIDPSCWINNLKCVCLTIMNYKCKILTSTFKTFKAWFHISTKGGLCITILLASGL